MMKTMILAATAAATVAFAGAAFAEDFPATPMNSGPPTMPMMQPMMPMMQPMAAPEKPMMQKKMTRRQKMMMKKKMMMQEPAQ